MRILGAHGIHFFLTIWVELLGLRMWSGLALIKNVGFPRWLHQLHPHQADKSLHSSANNSSLCTTVQFFLFVVLFGCGLVLRFDFAFLSWLMKLGTFTYDFCLFLYPVLWRNLSFPSFGFLGFFLKKFFYILDTGPFHNRYRANGSSNSVLCLLTHNGLFSQRFLLTAI